MSTKKTNLLDFFEHLDSLATLVNNQFPGNNLEAFMKIAANWQNGSQNLLEAVDLKGEMQHYMNNTTMNMYKKRERTQNWNHQEKKFLLDLCRKDMRIIENKRLDAGLTAVKNKAWKIIHQKFSRQFGTDRTCNRLKEQWRRMKACTRNEILDYNNRLAKFGEEVADRKRPSSFTFEVWEFMQEAKKACKSEALDGIDYSKIPLSLEEDFDYHEDEHNAEEDHDIDDSRTPPQELCDVDIKEETSETINDHFNSTYQDHFGDTAHNNTDSSHCQRLLSTVSPGQTNNSTAESLRQLGLHSPLPGVDLAEQNLHFLTNGNTDLGGFQPTFTMSNISATLEALKAIRNGQFSNAAMAAAVMQKKMAATSQQSIIQTPFKRPRTSSPSGHSDMETNSMVTEDSEASTRKLQISDESQQQQQPQLGKKEDGEETNSIIKETNQPSTEPASCSGSVLESNTYDSSTNFVEIQTLMNMQKEEHTLRMKILEIQLQAAKHNRDLIEINKTFALQRLQDFANRRLTN